MPTFSIEEGFETFNCVVGFILTFVTIWFIYCLLFCQTTRSKGGYNFYIVFLLIVDALLHATTFISEAQIVYDALYATSPNIYPYYVAVFGLSMYVNFNFWMNAVIALEVYNLLRKSKKRLKCSPPSIKKAFIQGLCVLLFSLTNAIWSVLDVPWSRYTIEFVEVDVSSSSSSTAVHTRKVVSYHYGSPDGGKTISSGTSKLVTLLLLLLPTLAVFYTRIQVKLGNLLPISGKTRVVSNYFSRITVSFLACYIPFLVLTMIGTSMMADEQGSIVGLFITKLSYQLIPIQTVVTLCVIMTKPDIRACVLNSYKKLHRGRSPVSNEPPTVTSNNKDGTKRKSNKSNHIITKDEDVEGVGNRLKDFNFQDELDYQNHGTMAISSSFFDTMDDTEECTSMPFSDIEASVRNGVGSFYSGEMSNMSAVFSWFVSGPNTPMSNSNALQKEWFMSDVYESDLQDSNNTGDNSAN